MILCNEFCEMTMEEKEVMNGGGIAEGVLTGAGGVMTTLGVCSVISGSSTTAIASMGVASLAACGPIGWAVLGAAVVGGVVTGVAAYNAAKN